MNSDKTPDFFFLFILLFLGLFLSGCEERTRDKNEFGIDVIPRQDGDASRVTHAIGFDVEKHSNYTVLHFFRHFNGDRDTVNYVIARKSATLPNSVNDHVVIRTPVQSVALLHSSYLAYFDVCNGISSIAAIADDEYIYNSSCQSYIQQGQIISLGNSEHLDREKILALNPDLVVTVGFPNAPNKNKEILESLGYPVLLLSEWQEPTLLGRMEWIKVIGMLLEADSLAEASFHAAEREYMKLTRLAENVKSRPSVLCNAPYKDSWYVPAGDSYISHLISDSGAEYIWKETDGTGGIPLDFEMVFARASAADYWINPGQYQSKQALLNADERLGEFRNLQQDQIYNCYNRINGSVANDYWESGLVKPHVILADMIKIMHPDLLPDHHLYYFNKLE